LTRYSPSCTTPGCSLQLQGTRTSNGSDGARPCRQRVDGFTGPAGHAQGAAPALGEVVAEQFVRQLGNRAGFAADLAEEVLNDGRPVDAPAGEIGVASQRLEPERQLLLAAPGFVVDAAVNEHGRGRVGVFRVGFDHLAPQPHQRPGDVALRLVFDHQRHLQAGPLLRGIMKFLLTSAGIKNTSIHNALVDLLGKPIAESSALCIPTAIYPFPGGPSMAYRFISGSTANPMCELGWKSLGVLELTALPSIKEEYWIAAVRGG
jgi:hypothetical protein